MKLFLLILCLKLSGTFASSEVQHDVVLKSRFDSESSKAFIEQLRIFLKTNDFGDPYDQTFPEPISFDLQEALKEVPLDTQAWIREFQSMLRIKLFESNYKLVIHNLRYTIDDFNSELKTKSKNPGRVEYVTHNSLRGISIRAEKIVFQVELQRTQSGEPIEFSIELMGPKFNVSQDFRAELPMAWTTSVLPENILLTLEGIDISSLMEKVTKGPNLVEFTLEDTLIPELAVKVGHKTVKFDSKKIKSFFITRKEELKRGLLDIINGRMSETFNNVIKGEPKDLLLRKAYFIDTDVKGVLDVQEIKINKTGIVEFNLSGHYCDHSAPIPADLCKGKEIPAKERRKVSLEQYKKSLRAMNRNLIENNTNIALSVSEDYLNHLIEATIKAGLWEDKLSGNNFYLGPEKSFTLAEERGELFSLYLDIVYKLKGAQKLLVGKSELRFPVKFMIALDIKNQEGMPHFTIKVKKIATTKDLLLKGAPELGLPSTVSKTRFTKKVLKAIMEDVGAFDNQTLVDVEFEELQGTYLDQLKFFSDGLGRGTATIGF